MSQHYSDPAREGDPHALPDIEVFYVSTEQVAANEHEAEAGGKTFKAMAEGEIDYNAYAVGWYYWSCFPGCLPDSDPIGPFNSEAEAVTDAQNS